MKQTESDAVTALTLAALIVEAERAKIMWSMPARADVLRLASELMIVAESLCRQEELLSGCARKLRLLVRDYPGDKESIALIEQIGELV